jgi:AcrR family transcriptional regulator
MELMAGISTKTNSNKLDPRVARTRRLLLDSFSELLAEHKSIRKISIQSITEHAGVNRVTFYAHFTDKYELLSAWKREIFREALTDKQLHSQNARDITFEQLIDTVLDFMSSYKRYFRLINKEYEPLFEAALQEELADILLEMLKSKPSHTSMTTQTTATFLSWAIFGTANEWSTKRIQESKDAIAHQLLQLVSLVANHQL